MSAYADAEVLVIGAGPVGLCLAGDLARRGHKVILVEQSDGVVEQPKMDMVGIRTMEFIRRWGLTDRVRQAGYNRQYPQDNVFLTTLVGHEIGRQPMPAPADEVPPPQSPATRERCPQNFFDPVLQGFAREQGVQIRFETRYLGLTQHADRVEARLVDVRSGAQSTVNAQFLVACDGGNSAIRQELGIAMNGAGLLTYTTNVIFEAPGFNALHNKTPGYRYMVFGPDGAWGTIVAIDGRDRWRMSIIGGKEPQEFFTEEQAIAFAYRMVGRPFDLKVLSILPWIRSELVAERYHEGRVILCGDACHRTSPTAGLGMNTGIGDAVDLSWKLSAILGGWGDQAGLLNSYDAERIPVGRRITRFSTSNLETMKGARSSDAIHSDSDEGRAERRRLRRYLDEGLRREWFSLNMHLGYRYTESPVIWHEPGEDPAEIAAEFEEAILYRQSTRPGARAPHAWLRDGRSMLDLYGDGFVMVCFEAADAEEAEATMALAARALGIPLRIELVEQPEIANLYDRRFVLVRPDGHVAWRGEHLPDVPEQVLRKVVGRG